MTKNKISLLEYFCLAFFLSHGLFLFLGNRIIIISKTDTLFSCALGTILNFLLLKGFFFIKRRKKSSTLLSLLIFLFLLFFTIFLMRETAVFIQQIFLKEGNIFYILLLLFLLSLLISKRKIPQVASLALLSLFLFVITFSFQLLGSMMNLNFHFLKPPLVMGPLPLIKGALLFSLLSFFPLLLLFFIPYEQVNEEKKERKYLTYALLFSNLITIVQFVMIALGPSLSLAEVYRYPYMLVINQIASFLILDRMSYLFSIFVLLDSTILLGTLFTLMKENIPQKLIRIFHLD